MTPPHLRFPVNYNPRIHYILAHDPAPNELEQKFIELPWCQAILLPDGKWITRKPNQPVKEN